MCLLVIIGAVVAAIGAATTGEWGLAAVYVFVAFVALTLPALMGHENG